MTKPSFNLASPHEISESALRQISLRLVGICLSRKFKIEAADLADGWHVYTFTSSSKLSQTKCMQARAFVDGLQFGLTRV